MKRFLAGDDQDYPDYFVWLCELVSVDGRYTDVSYWRLARELFDLLYFCDNDYDESRAMDGLALRRYYIDSGGTDPYEGECTVLEVLIALARRIENTLDELDGESRIAMYFWEMIENLELGNLSDFAFEEDSRRANGYMRRIDRKITNWMEHHISYNGAGGPFPLRNPKCNQAYVDLWYQACAYIDEHYI